MNMCNDVKWPAVSHELNLALIKKFVMDYYGGAYAYRDYFGEVHIFNQCNSTRISCGETEEQAWYKAYDGIVQKRATLGRVFHKQLLTSKVSQLEERVAVLEKANPTPINQRLDWKDMHFADVIKAVKEKYPDAKVESDDCRGNGKLHFLLSECGGILGIAVTGSHVTWTRAFSNIIDQHIPEDYYEGYIVSPKSLDDVKNIVKAFYPNVYIERDRAYGHLEFVYSVIAPDLEHAYMGTIPAAWIFAFNHVTGATLPTDYFDKKDSAVNTTQREVLTVTLLGDTFGKESIVNIAEQIAKAAQKGIEIRFE